MKRLKRLTYDQYQAAISALLQLRGAFPEAIARLNAYKRKPLKLGIHHDILALLPEVDPRIVGVAMRIYCGHPGYLQSMIEGEPRVDLEGAIAGVVTAEEALKARNEFEVQQRRREARRAAKAMKTAKLQGKLTSQPLEGSRHASAGRGELFCPKNKNRKPSVGLAGLKAAARARSASTAT